MSLKWYAIKSTLASKEKLISELKAGGYSPKSGIIKDILIFEFTQDNLDINDKEDSLLEGYVLLRLDPKKLKDLLPAFKNKKVGEFFNFDKEGTPIPIPDEQVRAFKRKVRAKKGTIYRGQLVRVQDGALSGFLGKVIKKKALMAMISVQLPNRVVKRWVAIPNLSTNVKE